MFADTAHKVSHPPLNAEDALETEETQERCLAFCIEIKFSLELNITFKVNDIKSC